jgi:hypothetical protein
VIGVGEWHCTWFSFDPVLSSDASRPFRVGYDGVLVEERHRRGDMGLVQYDTICRLGVLFRITTCQPNIWPIMLLFCSELSNGNCCYFYFYPATKFLVGVY